MSVCVLVCLCFVFFFKQKTAYEMRISDWSSDVCSSDLSAVFTMNLREAETFLSASGSDCGIANVNIGTSGAEIGGAFGGEKETGGGRESGSDEIGRASGRGRVCQYV